MKSRFIFHATSAVTNQARHFMTLISRRRIFACSAWALGLCMGASALASEPNAKADAGNGTGAAVAGGGKAVFWSRNNERFALSGVAVANPQWNAEVNADDSRFAFTAEEQQELVQHLRDTLERLVALPAVRQSPWRAFSATTRWGWSASSTRIVAWPRPRRPCSAVWTNSRGPPPRAAWSTARLWRQPPRRPRVSPECPGQACPAPSTPARTVREMRRCHLKDCASANGQATGFGLLSQSTLSQSTLSLVQRL